MSSQAVDEETPLLQAKKQKARRTPLPWRQFCIIMFLQLSEPLTSQVIAPFAPQVCPRRLSSYAFSSNLLPFKLIRDIGITKGDETQVGYYVGLLVCLYNLSFHVTSSNLNAVAFVILRDASPHCIALESRIGPYRPKTCHTDWFVRLVCFNVLFWSIEDLLGIGHEVLSSFVTHFAQWLMKISVPTFI